MAPSIAPFNRILCPVDLSSNSTVAIELATTIAKRDGATVAFLFVAPQWSPEESMMGADYIQSVVEQEKSTFESLRPTDSSVPCEHVFVYGNAGPEIVRAARSADSVIMSTHGRSGLARFLMGSVAQYVLRNAQCPVILTKTPQITKHVPTPPNRSDSADSGAKSESQSADSPPTPVGKNQTFVTDLMHQTAPVHTFDDMESVLAELNKARETAAPVVDGSGVCIGILTTTDIARYRGLRERFEQKDETVIDEMFEVDCFGQRRPTNTEFGQVERHMTKEVISVTSTDSVEKASERFKAHPDIHHLVVLDDRQRPVGIVNALVFD